VGRGTAARKVRYFFVYRSATFRGIGILKKKKKRRGLDFDLGGRERDQEEKRKKAASRGERKRPAHESEARFLWREGRLPNCRLLSQNQGRTDVRGPGETRCYGKKRGVKTDLS